MAHLTIKHLESFLANKKPDEYAYVEIGRYKPYMMATVRAAIKRGYRVECRGRSRVYYVYPKEAV